MSLLVVAYGLIAVLVAITASRHYLSEFPIEDGDAVDGASAIWFGVCFGCIWPLSLALYGAGALLANWTRNK